MKNFLIGLVGAILFSATMGFVLLRIGGMSPNLLYYFIVGIAGFNGFIIFERAAKKRR